MIISKEYFRIWLVLTLIISFHLGGFSNSDTLRKSNRAFFGCFIGGGITQSDFSELRQESYFLNHPSNLYGNFGATAFIGNPDKLFFSIPFSIIIPQEKKDTYLGYDMKLGLSGNSFGGQIGYQIYRNKNRSILSAIYLLAGAKRANYIFTSRASGSGIINTDTTFYYEYSKAQVLYLTPEIMIELFNLVKTQDQFPAYPLTLKLGYNFQVENPKWIIYESSSQILQRNNTMNGFYISIGINFWLKKGNYARK